MFFDESEIEEAHGALLRVEPIKVMLGCLSAAVDLVRKSYIQNAHTPVEQMVIFSIGVRTVNSTGACLKLAGCGYFAPAFHQLRDLAELGLLIEYFIAKPEKIIEWSEVAGWERVDKFRFNKIEKVLRCNFNVTTRWLERFNHYSELGTHVGAAGAYAIVKDNEWQYGPHNDNTKFIQIFSELTIDIFEVAEAYFKLFNEHYGLAIQEAFPKDYAFFIFAKGHARQIYERLMLD